MASRDSPSQSSHSLVARQNHGDRVTQAMLALAKTIPFARSFGPDITTVNPSALIRNGNPVADASSLDYRIRYPASGGWSKEGHPGLRADTMTTSNGSGGSTPSNPSWPRPDQTNLPISGGTIRQPPAAPASTAVIPQRPANLSAHSPALLEQRNSHPLYPDSHNQQVQSSSSSLNQKGYAYHANHVPQVSRPSLPGHRNQSQPPDAGTAPISAASKFWVGPSVAAIRDNRDVNPAIPSPNPQPLTQRKSQINPATNTVRSTAGLGQKRKAASLVDQSKTSPKPSSQDELSRPSPVEENERPIPALKKRARHSGRPIPSNQYVHPLDSSKALQVNTYDHKNIARNVLVASGRHPTMPGLNMHLEVLEDRLKPFFSNRSDLATINWRHAGPKIDGETLASRGWKDYNRPTNGQENPPLNMAAVPYISLAAPNGQPPDAVSAISGLPIPPRGDNKVREDVSVDHDRLGDAVVHIRPQQSAPNDQYRAVPSSTQPNVLAPRALFSRPLSNRASIESSTISRQTPSKDNPGRHPRELLAVYVPEHNRNSQDRGQSLAPAGPDFHPRKPMISEEEFLRCRRTAVQAQRVQEYPKQRKHENFLDNENIAGTSSADDMDLDD